MAGLGTAARELERPLRRISGGPGLLQGERKRRRWSHAKLIAELRKVAVREGYQLPGDTSLASMASRWENGHCEPDPFYRYLLRQVYGKSDAELGFRDVVDDADGRVWLTMEDFCRELEVPPSTAYKWSSFGSASGRFPRFCRLPNGKIRIHRQWLNEWLDGLPTV
jgi:hypothetical protein